MVVGISVLVTVRMVAVRMRVLAMIMVVRMVVVVMTGCGHDGLEYLVGFLVGDFVALEHLPDGEVVLDEQVALRELGGEMQVADLPSSVGSFTGIRIGDLEHCLRKLLYEVTFLAGEME